MSAVLHFLAALTQLLHFLRYTPIHLVGHYHHGYHRAESVSCTVQHGCVTKIYYYGK